MYISLLKLNWFSLINTDAILWHFQLARITAKPCKGDWTCWGWHHLHTIMISIKPSFSSNNNQKERIRQLYIYFRASNKSFSKKSVLDPLPGGTWRRNTTDWQTLVKHSQNIPKCSSANNFHAVIYKQKQKLKYIRQQSAIHFTSSTKCLTIIPYNYHLY